MDDMYRGEFENSHGKTINFDIQDVGGGFVYDFPAMKSVSIASADAFVLGKDISLLFQMKNGFHLITKLCHLKLFYCIRLW